MEENEIGTVIVDCAVNFGEVLMRDGITRTINGNLCTTSVSPCLREKPRIDALITANEEDFPNCGDLAIVPLARVELPEYRDLEGKS